MIVLSGERILYQNCIAKELYQQNSYTCSAMKNSKSANNCFQSGNDTNTYMFWMCLSIYVYTIVHMHSQVLRNTLSIGEESRTNISLDISSWQSLLEPEQNVYSYILIICVKYPDILSDNSCPFLKFPGVFPWKANTFSP